MFSMVGIDVKELKPDIIKEIDESDDNDETSDNSEWTPVGSFFRAIYFFACASQPMQ